MIDSREKAAAYYDLNPAVPHDVPFYSQRVPSPDACVLELGCGTGRVLLGLLEWCREVHGIDSSQAMLARCRAKLESAGIPSRRASVEHGDITGFDLGREFELIIAPYVFQSLESDEEIDRLFACIHTHLSPRGTCVLNTFMPHLSPDALRREWCTGREELAWEAEVGAARVTCHRRRPRMDPDRLVLFPELVFRRHENGVVTDETVLGVVMRCHYPDEFKRLVVDHGFKIMGSWGGYAGETYGSGPELVVQFTA